MLATSGGAPRLRRSPRFLCRAVAGTLVIGLTVAPPSAVVPVAAQVIDVPTFVVTDAKPFPRIEVAAGYGGLYFITGAEFEPSYLHRYDGATLTVAQVGAAAISTDPLGGYPIVGWLFVAVGSSGAILSGVYGGRLDGGGAVIGSSPAVIVSDGALAAGGVAGLATGSVVTWVEQFGTLLARRFSLAGEQLGSPVVITSELSGEHDVAATVPDGFAVAWKFSDGVNRGIHVQLFDDDLHPRGFPFTVTGELTAVRVAASPFGGTAAVVGFRDGATAGTADVVLRRFMDGGATIGGDIVVATVAATASQVVAGIDVEFGLAGDVYVVWGTPGFGHTGLHARLYDAAGAPLGPVEDIAGEPATGWVRTARLPDGRFVNAWSDWGIAGKTWANVVSPCAPGTAVCGDGVLAAACERCDDGVGNSDTLPDACRTDCVPAHCGDGVVDAGEGCDDGNLTRCDGCDAFCQVEPGIVCGDGVTSRLCGEQCDDGDTRLLDGCTPACTLERIPGGGSSQTDCFTEWSIDNPANVPARDKRGAISAKQTCVDDDPACDFDGGVPGSCTFRLRACANNTDVPACRPPGRIASWQLDHPSVKQAARRPWLAAVRTTLTQEVSAAIVGPSDPDVCTNWLSVAVPLSGTSTYRAGKLILQTHAVSYEGETDKDKLRLTCLPRP